MGVASCAVVLLVMASVACAVVLLVMASVAGVNEAAGATSSLSPLDLTHRIVLDERGKYVLMWTPRERDIIFEVQVATVGYVGLGFSPSGGMKGADIILGWVDDFGNVFLSDRHATGYRPPIIDESQDVDLLGGYQNDTHTLIRFSRPWDTCDRHSDVQLMQDETTKLIWSYGEKDPTREMKLRKHQERGSRSLLLQPQVRGVPTLGEDVKAWDILSSNVVLPSDQTTLYWCTLHKSPPLTTKPHVIGFVPVINERNIKLVHHILVFECHVPDSARHYEKWLDVKGFQCYSPSMPASWSFCSTPIFAWGIGGDGEMFPEHVGLPLGEQYGGATYFLREIHYDNPDLEQGLVDASGIRIFYTETPREYDAGMMSVGHTISALQIIPPRQEWRTVGICHPDCTQQGLPERGVRVFQGLLHSHVLGTTMRLRHVRQGQELQPLLKDMNFDFNFQHSIVVKDVALLPGDTLILECGYDSTRHNQTTFGGFSTDEEMCLAFLLYYPRVPLSICFSMPQFQGILQGVGVHDIYNGAPLSSNARNFGNVINEEAESVEAAAFLAGKPSPKVTKIRLADVYRNMFVKSPQKYHNASLFQVLNDGATWTDGQNAATLQDKIINGSHVTRCFTSQGNVLDGPESFFFPTFTPFEPPVGNCSKGQR